MNTVRMTTCDRFKNREALIYVDLMYANYNPGGAFDDPSPARTYSDSSRMAAKEKWVNGKWT